MSVAATRPRLVFLGVGWIGRNRLDALAASGIIDVAAVADADPEAARSAAAAHGCEAVTSLADLLDRQVDGVVIATPSAQHAEQALASLDRKVAVFCQKPLGRNAAEAEAVVDAAASADVLLGVDFCYRYVAAFACAKALLAEGDVGTVYAADFVFHNAYGPDKPWFYDPSLSGGGCVIDLGTHLVDLALWTLDGPKVDSVTSRMFSRGRPLPLPPRVAEDYALARLDFASGACATIACSWNLAAGRDAVIGATLYGTDGALAVSNVDGSFYDFTLARHRGTATETLVEPPDDWGGRAITAWAVRLRDRVRFDPSAAAAVDVARTIDAIYGR